MNWKTWVPLVLAIVLGLIAAKAARDVISKNRTASNNKLTRIVVTRGDVHPGAVLSAADVTLTQVDAANAPAASFNAIDKVVGRVSETLMVKGQPVIEAMLAPVGSGSGLQALVPPGMRAITIEVNEYTGVGAMITPGCRVDVIATLNDPKNDGRIAKTIVQNVKVTAVGQRTSGVEAPSSPSEMSKSVTILASLEDAEAIELACAMGKPRLVLRGGRDNDVMTTAGVSLNDLKGTGGRLDTGTSSMAVITPPTTAPAIVPPAVVITPTTPTTIPAHAVVLRSPTPATVDKRVVRIVRGGRVSLVSLSSALETPEKEMSPAENVAESGSKSSSPSDDAVGSIDPFDSK
jgi:pilus assembly protein CpaB